MSRYPHDSNLDNWTLVLMALFLLVVFVGVGVKMNTEGKCLSAGYPEAKITFTLQRYCIKRVDQTDVVVPLVKALAEKAQ